MVVGKIRIASRDRPDLEKFNSVLIKHILKSLQVIDAFVQLQKNIK